jgi:N-acetylneuraminate synthase
MANMQELIEAKQVYLSNNFDLEKLSVLHCVSCYPATVESVNLRAIEAIRIELGCNVGWSDHTCDKDVILSALFVHGAKIIELHFDLDSFGAEANLGHCWLPDDVVALKKTMEKYRSMSGSGTKEPSNAELVERSWRADPKDGLRPISAIRGNLNLR